MAINETPQPLDLPQAVPGDPLMPSVGAADLPDPSTPMGDTSAPLAPPAAVGDVPPVITKRVEDVSPPRADAPVEEDVGPGKLKTGALLAGAAALANKVRQEAPKKVQQLREKRAEGRCVIVTEVDGRMLAIGPYKDAASAEPHVFRVGGNPHIVELVTDTAFFSLDQERTVTS